MMHPIWITLAALLGLMALAAGALRAHVLEHKVAREKLFLFEVGMRYQIFHALATIATLALAAHLSPLWREVTVGCFVGGGFLFGIAMYASAFSPLEKIRKIAPVAGFIMMSGWLCLAIAAW